MDGVAADHAAERNRRIIGLAVVLGGIERDRDRGRNFQRAGHRDDVVADAGGLQLGDRAFQQRILDIVIEPRLDDQRARAGDVGLVLQRCAPRVCHHASSSVSVIAGLDRQCASGSDGWIRVVKRAYGTAMRCVYFISDSRAA